MEKWIFGSIMAVFVFSVLASIAMDFNEQKCLQIYAQTERSVTDIRKICTGK